MMHTKELIWALGMAWVVMAMVGCSSGHPPQSKTLLGDHTNHQSIEYSNGVVQNLQTGRTGVRRGAWVQDLQTGKMAFTYGGFVEESPQ